MFPIEIGASIGKFLTYSYQPGSRHVHTLQFEKSSSAVSSGHDVSKSRFVRGNFPSARAFSLSESRLMPYCLLKGKLAWRILASWLRLSFTNFWFVMLPGCAFVAIITSIIWPQNLCADCVQTCRQCHPVTERWAVRINHRHFQALNTSKLYHKSGNFLSIFWLSVNLVLKSSQI